MNDQPPPSTLEDLAARIAELALELRRQGRAAVAAQAAAEACLAAIEERGEPADEPEPAWLAPLLPVADAIDRIDARAASLLQERSRPRTLLRWPLGKAPDPDLAAIAGAVRILRAQMAQALESLDVTIERRVGIPVDPELHRVVDVRMAGSAEGTIVEVVRPGYSLGGRVVREAEVVVSSARTGSGGSR